MNIANFIKKRMPKVYDTIYKCGFNSGYSEAKKKQTNDWEESRRIMFEVNHELGTPIIAVPNEHENMIIGFVVEHDTISQAKTPIAIVFDYVRNKEILLLPKAYPYNESFARTISELHPDDRHVLFYGHEKNFSSIDEQTIIGWEKMRERLEENGFFKELNAYQQRKEQERDESE